MGQANTAVSCFTIIFIVAFATATKYLIDTWKRRISLAASRAIIYQAHYALRKHLHDCNPDYDELSDDEFDDREIHMNELDEALGK